VASLSELDYQRLLQFRTGLRQFLHWSETQAHAVGLTPAQHQLLLAVRGHPGSRRPTIGDIAESLLLKHHSAVGLVDRAEAGGLVERRPDRDDQRVVRIHLTALGNRRLAQLSELHLAELRRVAPRLQPLLRALDPAPAG
jgi:DNA-binding MarR family transcriptional regulator